MKIFLRPRLFPDRPHLLPDRPRLSPDRPRLFHFKKNPEDTSLFTPLNTEMSHYRTQHHAAARKKKASNILPSY